MDRSGRAPTTAEPSAAIPGKGFQRDRQTAAERLNPPRSSSRYHHFRALRSALQQAIDAHVANRGCRLLVDWGCGNMPYRSLFEEHVERYVGVDIPGNPLADHVVGDQLRCNLPDESADVVLSTQVLEHVEKPDHYLREAQRLLKPGGVLVLSTHGYWMYHPDPTDFWRWTAEGLRSVIERTGFDVLQVRGVMGLASVGAQLLQDGLIGKLPRAMRKVAIFCFQPVIALLDRWHSQQERDRDACVFLVVARKASK